MANISAIAALGKNNLIGRTDGLVWRIPEDLKRFKALTMGHPVIMGRKTYDSIGRALPGRTNIVITKNKDFSAEGCIVANSVDEAIEKAKEAGEGEIFIIGGGEIYKQALPYTDKLYLTLVKDSQDGNVFFPDYSDFTKETFREEREYKGLKYSWVDLERS
jgi:dihydrofolate reductase